MTPRGKGWSTDIVAVPFNITVAGEFVRGGQVMTDLIYRDRKTVRWMHSYSGLPLTDHDGRPITPDAWMPKPKLVSGR